MSSGNVSMVRGYISPNGMGREPWRRIPSGNIKSKQRWLRHHPKPDWLADMPMLVDVLNFTGSAGYALETQGRYLVTILTPLTLMLLDSYPTLPEDSGHILSQCLPLRNLVSTVFE